MYRKTYRQTHRHTDICKYGQTYGERAYIPTNIPTDILITEIQNNIRIDRLVKDLRSSK